MVNVGFYGGGIRAELVSGNDGRLLGLLHDPLMDLLSTLLAKERKSPTPIAKIWNRILIKAREAAIQKAGSQFAVKFPIRPAFDMLEHHAPQQPIRSDPFAADFVRAWRALGQSLSAQRQQLRVFKQPINCIEGRIPNGGCFLKEGESK